MKIYKFFLLIKWKTKKEFVRDKMKFENIEIKIIKWVSLILVVTVWDKELFWPWETKSNGYMILVVTVSQTAKQAELLQLQCHLGEFTATIWMSYEFE